MSLEGPPHLQQFQLPLDVDTGDESPASSTHFHKTDLTQPLQCLRIGVRPIFNSDANWTSDTIEPGSNLRVVIISSKRRKATSVSGSPAAKMSDWLVSAVLDRPILTAP